ncbi:hypothetical protein [Pedobacter nutrimenti]|jgi:hypothetical protein|nr:hypothetical protein [Pedobacter nutrimenti]
MKKNLSHSLNRFGWMLHVCGNTTINLIEEAEPGIEDAYKSLTDIIFEGIVEEPEKTGRTHRSIKKQLLKLMEEAKQIMALFKRSSAHFDRYVIAYMIHSKMQTIYDFLDDFEALPSNK